MKICGFKSEYKFEKTEIIFLNRSFEFVENDETKIVHRQSEWNWTILDEKVQSIILSFNDLDHLLIFAPTRERKSKRERT